MTDEKTDEMTKLEYVDAMGNPLDDDLLEKLKENIKNNPAPGRCTSDSMDILDRMIKENGFARPICGAGVGDGWLKLTEKAIIALRDLGDVTIDQIKEKFGGIRLYFSCPEEKREAADAIVSALEKECWKTCEECGEPGESRRGGWTKTLCDTHSNGRTPYNEDETGG